MRAVLVFCFFFELSVVWADNAEETCLKLSKWGPWRCPGDETACSGDEAVRYKCPEGDCTENSQCTSLSGFLERRNCKEALEAGLCTPTWSAWTEWSSCSAACGSAERTRFRACVGAWKASSEGAPPGTCADPARASEGMERRDCPLRRLCPRIAGGWGEWGPYSNCSALCGKGYRQRIRLCNRPAPQGGGLPCQGIDTQRVMCDAGVLCPQDGDWCPWAPTVERCSQPCGDSGMGLRIRRCSCLEPAFGGSACKAPPGAKDVARLARIQRQRLIASGKEADEKDEEAAAVPHASAITAIEDGSGRWDPCNRQACPYSKRLTLEEEELIQADLRLQRPEATWVWSGEVPARRYDPVGLHCPGARKSRVQIFEKKRRFPRARPYWTLSIGRSPLQPHSFPGVPLVDSRRLQVTYDRLILRSLDSEDEGIYRFGYEYEPGKFSTICFFAVYLSDKTATVRSGDSFNLECNARGLWPIIQQTREDEWTVYWSYQPDENARGFGSKPIEQMWLSTIVVPVTDIDKKFRSQKKSNTSEDDNPAVPLTLFDTEQRRLDNVEFFMSGQYVCTVVSKEEGKAERRFITNSFHLKVIPPPTLSEAFIEWLKVNQNSLTALFVTLILVIITYVLLIKRRAKRIASTKNMDELDELQGNLAVVDAKIG